jgi:glutathione S-transferase
VNPYEKPAELMRINPRGLVPAIEHHGHAVYESMIIVEYLHEEFQGVGPDLMPQDAFERARARMMCDEINKKIVPAFYRCLQRQTHEEQEEAKNEILDTYVQLMKQMSTESPFFLGKTFGMVDICLLPWVCRHEILHHYRGFTLPDTREFDRFRKWEAACLREHAVLNTLQDKVKLRETYDRYATNTAKSQVAQAINSGAALP